MPGHFPFIRRHKGPSGCILHRTFCLSIHSLRTLPCMMNIPLRRYSWTKLHHGPIIACQIIRVFTDTCISSYRLAKDLAEGHYQPDRPPLILRPYPLHTQAMSPSPTGETDEAPARRNRSFAYRMLGSNAWWPTSRSISTCCRRRSEKKSKARPPPGTGPVVSWDVSGELCAGLSLSTVWSSLVVSTQPRERSVGASAAHS